MAAARPYMKATVAFVALLVAGVVAVALGFTVEGKTLVLSAPFVSGLVATVKNEPGA
jgi:hypothetical protein